MPMPDRFILLRHGILEHLQSGRLKPREFAVLIALLVLADSKTGVYRGCAISLLKACGSNFNEQGMQVSLRLLDEQGYIRRLRTHGQRGNHPILIDKYLVTTGRYEKHYLCAERSTDMGNLVYLKDDGVAEEDTWVEPDEQVEESSEPESEGTEELVSLFLSADREVSARDRRELSDFIRGGYKADSLKGVIQWGLAEKFWSTKITSPRDFIRHFTTGKLKDQYANQLKKRKPRYKEKNNDYVKKAAKAEVPPAPASPPKFTFTSAFPEESKLRL